MKIPILRGFRVGDDCVRVDSAGWGLPVSRRLRVSATPPAPPAADDRSRRTARLRLRRAHRSPTTRYGERHPFELAQIAEQLRLSDGRSAPGRPGGGEGEVRLSGKAPAARQAGLSRSSDDEAPLASAISASVAINLEPICSMRSSGSRNMGPAIVTTPRRRPDWGNIRRKYWCGAPASTKSRRRRRLWICRFAWTTQTRCPHTHSRCRSSKERRVS